MTEDARKLRAEYQRKWREKNKEKVKCYQDKYWEKRLEKMQDGAEEATCKDDGMK